MQISTANLPFPLVPLSARKSPVLLRKQLLVVDDTDDNLFLMRSLLEDFYTVF